MGLSLSVLLFPWCEWCHFDALSSVSEVRVSELLLLGCSQCLGRTRIGVAAVIPLTAQRETVQPVELRIAGMTVPRYIAILWSRIAVLSRYIAAPDAIEFTDHNPCLWCPT